MEVQIQTRKLIKPSSPTPLHLRELKLSCFDQIAPPAFGSFIFFFKAPINGHQTLKKLESSLSDVLTKFYPFAGRFIQDRNAIDCNDQGAEYLEARVSVSLNQFILEELDVKLVNLLVPYPNELVFTPTILAVQINEFDCGGLAIGTSFSHKFADGFTIFGFMNGWATCCRIGVDAVKCLSFETESLLPDGFKPTYKIPVPDDNLDTLITKRFIFTASTIAALKAKVGVGQFSRAQLLIALIWKVRISMAKKKDSLQIFPYNFRGKTALPIPSNGAGNLFINILVRFTANDDRNPDLLHLVNLVGNELRNAAESFGKAETAEDLFLSATNSSREIHETLSKGDTEICILTSLSKFPYYEADFGWGMPGWIASVHKDVEMVLLMDTRFDGGVEAWVTLEPDNMVRFEQDPDILAYTCKPSDYFTRCLLGSEN
ncbi:acetyl-CoA-benzylalcohol acetyltransferase [Gossypium raimondii]|uniref:Uncharacterized protein n=1 Tax=Gossypium raimondii TaxID=29730 RepID=A0A0D2PXT1_GOSRA|nr:acetyl-CoA-benzylalcohol acetyltransferase [Gossypium raimondii]KJB32103.1 hypothetical protein B456_005G224100 [Gossypium raimondii]MBA0586565.1 hypothetical protein [Gossypium raimondii]